jgi:SAM-dependent methyltransferase
MQDDKGFKRILTLSWVYKIFQTAVGSGRSKGWISTRFWNIAAGQKVVDIGCGPGNAIQHLPAGVKYVGFDISERYIAHAREKYADDPDKTFLVGVAENFISSLPEQMRDADLVIINGLLHHLEDDEAVTALKLGYQALAPQGRLVCLEACFLIHQAPFSRWLLKRDRGQNVRSEPEWKALFARVFATFETFVLTGLLRIPYTHIIIEARR